MVASQASLARREREKAETRRLILEAARELFTTVGYAETTMRGIAERIGYTATTIYHHFVDKDALLCELCASDFADLGRALRAIGAVQDPIERIRAMGQAYVRFAVEHPAQFRFMFLVERPIPTPEQVAHDPAEDGYQFLLHAVSQAMAAGRFRAGYVDPDEVAQMFWASVHGLAAIHVTMGGGKKQAWLELRDLENTCRRLCDAVMSGVMK